jgi:hypothetical protein
MLALWRAYSREEIPPLFGFQFFNGHLERRSRHACWASVSVGYPREGWQAGTVPIRRPLSFGDRVPVAEPESGDPDEHVRRSHPQSPGTRRGGPSLRPRHQQGGSPWIGTIHLLRRCGLCRLRGGAARSQCDGGCGKPSQNGSGPLQRFVRRRRGESIDRGGAAVRMIQSIRSNMRENLTTNDRSVRCGVG